MASTGLLEHPKRRSQNDLSHGFKLGGSGGEHWKVGGKTGLVKVVGIGVFRLA